MVVFRNNNDDTNPVDNDADAYGRLLQDTGSSQAFPTVVPGVPFSFELYILDQQGEVYLSDSSSVAKLIANCTGCDLTGNKITAN